MYINKLGWMLLSAIVSALAFSTPSTSSSFTNLSAQQNTSTTIIPAQLNIEIGGSNKEVIRRLRRAGYSEIKITKSSFIKVRAEACLGAERYKITIRKIGMRISRGEKIGTCRVEVPLTEIIAKLKSEGYRRIDATEGRDGNYVIRACERRQKSVIIIDRYGEIVRSKNVGRCGRGESFGDIRFSLRDEGFNRIRLVEKTRRGYIVEACKRGTQFRLRVRRDGEIRRERRVGRCTPPIAPDAIEEVLEKRGFDRITVTDRRLPGYRAEACRNNTRMEVLMNRYGDIMDSKVIDECKPPLSRKDIIGLLKDRGANRIKIEREGRRGFVVSACYRLERTKYILDAYGNTIKTTITGRCSPPPRISDVLRDFRKNEKLKEVGIFVEGCRKGKLLRFQLNRFGEVRKQENIGRCR